MHPSGAGGAERKAGSGNHRKSVAGIRPTVPKIPKVPPTPLLHFVQDATVGFLLALIRLISTTRFCSYSPVP